VASRERIFDGDYRFWAGRILRRSMSVEVKQKVLGTSLKDVEVYEIHTVNLQKTSKLPFSLREKEWGRQESCV